jgi:hypothetical protein
MLAALALPAPPVAPAQPVTAPELRAETGRLFRELAQLRGLPVTPGPPPVVVRTREERRRFVLGEMARKYPPARLEAERQALVAWGLLPEGFDLAGFLTDLVLEQAVAYYDPVGKVMVLAPWLGPEERREALAHELVHALQDRQVALDRFLGPGPGRSDEALARQAVVEGEAVALVLDLAFRRQGRMLALLPDVAAHRSAILTAGTGPFLSRAPRFLRAMLTAPYAHGLAFVHRVLRQPAASPAGSWTALDGVYRDPPRSTAEVLHPERYLDRRGEPVPIALPDLQPVLGPGARLVIDDQLGELVLLEIVGAPSDGPGLPEWAGGRYALWRDPAGAPVLLAVTGWASEGAAAAVARQLAARLRRKHGRDADGDAPAAWRRAGRADAVVLAGRTVVALEGAPEDRLAALVRAARYHAPGP